MRNDLRLDGSRDALTFVADNADDSVPVAVWFRRPVERDAMSNGTLVGKVLLRKRLIDHDRQRLVWPEALPEEGAGQDRHTERMEVPRRGLTMSYPEAASVGRPALDAEVRRPSSTLQCKRSDGSCLLDSGQATQPLDETHDDIDVVSTCRIGSPAAPRSRRQRWQRLPQCQARG